MDIAIFVVVLTLLLALSVLVWRGAQVNTQEFFPSQRARVISAVRLRAMALAAVAVVAFCAQFIVSQQRLSALNDKEQRLVQYEADLLRLRVDVELARKAAITTVAAAPQPAPQAEVAAIEPAAVKTALEVAQISVDRAVVRDKPAGRAQFTLTSGSRVQLRGVPADNSGRQWREATTTDGRHGWIAVEVLAKVES